MEGEHRIPAERERVWQALNDPETLKSAIRGCESLERQDGDRFEALVVAAVGPVKAKFRGAITLENLQPPESYDMLAEVKGGAAGFAKTKSRVELHAEGSDTLLRYRVDARIGGKLAQIGQRLVDGAAKKMADDFFKEFTAILSKETAA